VTSLNLLLGGNELNSGIASKLESSKKNLIVVDWKSNSTGVGELVKIDATDSNLPLELKSRNLSNFKSVWTSMDLAVPNLNQILIDSSLMGFEGGLTPITKKIMMAAWAKNGLAGREFRVVNQQDSNEVESLSHTFPQIVKPNMGSGSRGVTICTTPEELLAAIPESITISQDGIAIIEDFVEGTEFTVELLADQFGNIQLLAFSEKHHSRHILKSKVATALIYGWTSLNAYEVNELVDFSIEAFRVFDPKSTLGHLEVIYSTSSRKFIPVEIGFRSSGYIASHLVDISTGLDFMSLTKSVYNGEKLREW
jgi:carbamoylphosphate synthase large subunit